MADFNIQRGSVSFSTTDDAITITAGTDYIAPSSATSAFIRIVGHNYCGNGQTGQYSGASYRNVISIINPENILSSITFERWAENEAITVEWEIIEYVGPPGGQYEFIVRHTENLTLPSNEQTGDTSIVSGVSDDNDVVVFITSQGNSNGSARQNWNRHIGTSEWVSASNVGRVTRGSGSINSCQVSMAVVEFTGSSWSVQRITHSYSAANTNEDEAIAPIGSTQQAFIHTQIRSGGGNANDHGQTVYILNTTTLRHRCNRISTSVTAVTWIIEDTSGSMSVSRFSGNRANGAGSSPDLWTETINAVTLATTSIMGECSETSGTQDGHHMCIGFELTDTNTVTLRRGANHFIRDYRFEIVEWPEAVVGGMIPAVLMHMGEL